MPAPTELPSDDELLSASFDPASLTIPQLKSQLSRFKVLEMPMSAKKSVYVDLFRKEITAKRTQLMRQMKTVRPSDRGIVEVSARGSPLAAAATAAKSGAAVGGARTRSQSRSPPTKGKRGRQSLVAAPSSDVDTDHDFAGTGERSFSRENPFQSITDIEPPSSSPPKPLSAEPSAAKRRQSLSRARSRRRTGGGGGTAADFLAQQHKDSPSAQKFMASPDDIRKAAYERAALLSPATAATVRRVVRWTGVGTVVFAVLAFATHLQLWREMPYCTNTNDLTSVTPDYSFLGVPYPLPACRPCPPHAQCSGAAIRKCANGYLIKHPIYPYHAHCAPDLLKYEYVDRLVSMVESIVSQHAGRVECGELSGEAFLRESRLKPIIRPAFKELSDDRFDNYWALMIDDGHLAGGRRVSITQMGREPVFIANHPAHSFMCQVTKGLADLLDAYRHRLWQAFGLTTTIYLLYRYYHARRAHRARILMLADSAVEHLIEQEKLYRSALEEHPAMSNVQLRDYLLMDVRSLPKRNAIWNDVRRELLQNSSLRETVIEIKGEQHDGLQWVGSALLNPSSRRKSQLLESPQIMMQQQPPAGGYSSAF